MSDLREEIDLWEGLLKHEKYQQLVEWCEEQYNHRTQMIVQKYDNIREEDVLRGETLGILMFKTLAENYLEGLRVELDNKTEGGA